MNRPDRIIPGIGSSARGDLAHGRVDSVLYLTSVIVCAGILVNDFYADSFESSGYTAGAAIPPELIISPSGIWS